MSEKQEQETVVSAPTIGQKFVAMIQGVLMFLGFVHIAATAGLYEPSITIKPAMAQAIAETVQAEYDNQRAIVAKLNAPAKAKAKP